MAKLNARAPITLVIGLIIILLLSFYICTKLSQYYIVTSSTRSNTSFADDNIMACVMKEENQCVLYPCHVQNNGEMKEVVPSNFGYAGHFVQRQMYNRTKPLPETLGDTGWASGCIVSDEYKFVFVHVLKSGGTAVKKFIKDSLCGTDAKVVNIEGSYTQVCKDIPEWIVRADGCKKSIRDHQDYFHFSFVRNPFTRLYSAYR